MACAKYGTGKKYGTGVHYCSSVSARGISAVFYEATAHALSVRLQGSGRFQLDTIKALAQDTKYVATGYGVFPDLAGVTFLSVRIRGRGAVRLDAIRPVARIMRKQLHG